MSFTTNSANNVYNSKQYNIVFNQNNGSRNYPYTEGYLAPTFSKTLTTYTSGRLLATLSAADSTAIFGTAAYAGFLIDWNPTAQSSASTPVPYNSVRKLTHVLAGEWVSNAVGATLNSDGTLSNLLKVSAYPVVIGSIFYAAGIVNANESTIGTYFGLPFTSTAQSGSYFSLVKLQNIRNNSVSDIIFTVQSLQAATANATVDTMVNSDAKANTNVNFNDTY